MKKSNCIFFFFLIFAANRLAAVNQPKVDSLLRLIENSPDDTLKVNRLYLLGRYYDYFNSKERVTYFVSALNLAYTTKHTSGIKTISSGLITNLFHRNMYDLALKYCHEYMSFLESEGDTDELQKTYNLYANLLSRQEKNDEALFYYNKALQYNKTKGNQKQAAYVLNNISILMLKQHKTDSAFYYGQLAIAIFRNESDQSALANSILGQAEISIQQNNPEQAEKLALEALSRYETANIEQGISNAESVLGQVYFKQQQYEKAIIHFNKALERIIPLKLYEQRKTLYLQLSDCYGKKGEFEKAYSFQLLYKQYNDSTTRQEQKNKMLEIEVKYDIASKETELQQKNAELERNNTRQNFLLSGIGGILLLLVISVRAFLLKKKTNKLISEQKKLVEEKQKEVLDSIHYARRIQNALLAYDALISENLADSFVLYRPKDIVSGDFYWACKNENGFYLAVCDSTGHGVPGAFMSLLNSMFLNEAVIEKQIAGPDEVFNYVRKRLIESISKEEQKDGMDGVLIQLNGKQLRYTAAHNRFIVIRNNAILEMKADRMPVGKGESEQPFTLHEISLQPGDVIYIYTDGYADQFGGPAAAQGGKKYKYKQLGETLLALHQLPMHEQHKKLEADFLQWKQHLEQVDDVLVLGLRMV